MPQRKQFKRSKRRVLKKPLVFKPKGKPFEVIRDASGNIVGGIVGRAAFKPVPEGRFIVVTKERRVSASEAKRILGQGRKQKK